MIEIVEDDDRISEDAEDYEEGEEDSKWSDIDSVYSTNSAIFIGGEQRSVPLPTNLNLEYHKCRISTYSLAYRCFFMW